MIIHFVYQLLTIMSLTIINHDQTSLTILINNKFPSQTILSTTISLLTIVNNDYPLLSIIN